jgi:hypothetical protein
MKTNEIKKGQRVKLRNGWEGTMADNARGNTRMVRVEGFYTETGSVYSHDIVAVQTQSGELDTGMEWTPVEHTPAQIKLRKIAG